MILRNRVVAICMKQVQICRVKRLLLYETNWNLPSEMVALKSPLMNPVKICRVKGCFYINLSDFEESKCHHMYETSSNLPSEKVAFVSTCAISRNQTVASCMKPGKLCRVKRLFLYQHVDLKESNCRNLYETSAFVSTCTIWRNQIVATCMKPAQICRVKT